MSAEERDAIKRHFGRLRGALASDNEAEVAELVADLVCVALCDLNRIADALERDRDPSVLWVNGKYDAG